MKTVITIVLDEDKENFGWRLDRSSDDNELKEHMHKMLEDAYNYSVSPDSLTEMKPQSALLECVIEEFKENFKEQFTDKYRLDYPETKEVGVL